MQTGSGWRAKCHFTVPNNSQLALAAGLFYDRSRRRAPPGGQAGGVWAAPANPDRTLQRSAS